ncbi:helix-turn-helix domain-containing protein [Streptosporangium sp. DT93]|uniref:helix-turn-helix domain-containing protein n=1 Tax=Streptosporangium sp. DT93 TaxID=3393428 RepID=UPI003CEC5743
MQDAGGWNPELFRGLLHRVMVQADLGQSDLVKLSGTSQATISRWIRAENQPQYKALQQLANGLVVRYTHLGDLPTRLLSAAGYGDKEYVPPTPQSEWEEELRQAREAAGAIEDPKQRDRVERIIDRELRETAELLQRRSEQLREIIDLILESDSH